MPEQAGRLVVHFNFTGYAADQGYSDGGRWSPALPAELPDLPEGPCRSTPLQKLHNTLKYMHSSAVVTDGTPFLTQVSSTPSPGPTFPRKASARKEERKPQRPHSPWFSHLQPKLTLPHPPQCQCQGLAASWGNPSNPSPPPEPVPAAAVLKNQEELQSQTQLPLLSSCSSVTPTQTTRLSSPA